MSWDRGYEKAAHLYDMFDRKKNIEFFLHYGLEAGDVLDIGAGTGRIALPLAEKGVRVFCVEPSPAMRREFGKKLAKRPDLAQRIEIASSDAANFDFHRNFPTAFLSGSFDHLLDDEERLCSLANIGRQLIPGGKIVFDVLLDLMKNSSLAPAGVSSREEKEYRRFVGGRILDDRKKEVILVFETWISGTLTKRIEEHSVVGLVTREQIHRLLEETGFEVRREFGDYDFTGFRRGNSLLIVEALKEE
jgi:SAM-dependent methyltransferase